MEDHKQKNLPHYYMVGIKGVGMTALAEYFVAHGHIVSGSDVPDIFFTDAVLVSHNIHVDTAFDAGLLPEDTDVLVHSTAYSDTNPQIAKARQLQIPVLSYPEALGSIFKESKGISVAGSHGKTTTTAMLGVILEHAKYDPTVIVGSNVPAFKGNARIGKSDIVVVETDEYQNKFQYYSPQHILLTNVEYDHPDFFASAEEYNAVFAEFVLKLPAQGILVANADDAVTQTMLASVHRPATLFGEGENAHYRIHSVQQKGEYQVFTLATPKHGDCAFSIQLQGRHNVMNAAAAAAFAIEFGVDPKHVVEALQSFGGTARRFEWKGKFHDADIIDDYAHHPTEIRASIAGARTRFPNRRLIVVFQPHTYSRTKALLSDFAASLTGDINILLEVYSSARETEKTVSSAEIAALVSGGRSVQVIPTISEVAEHLKKVIQADDVVLLMGAGDVWKIADLLLK